MAASHQKEADESSTLEEEYHLTYPARRKKTAATNSPVKKNFTAAALDKSAIWRKALLHGVNPKMHPRFSHVSRRRAQVWCFICRVDEYRAASPGLYKQLLLIPDEETDAAIEKDVRRTFSERPEFTELCSCGNNKLYNVLKAYSRYERKIGYCQGYPKDEIMPE